jgi:hypothetical protein
VESSYKPWRTLWKYLAGAAASRAGDEMTGPALLLLGFAGQTGPAAEGGQTSTAPEGGTGTAQGGYHGPF